MAQTLRSAASSPSAIAAPATLRGPCLSLKIARAARLARRLYEECDGIRPSLGGWGWKGMHLMLQPMAAALAQLQPSLPGPETTVLGR